MPKAQPLCTGARSNLGDRVLGKVEKNSFIALLGKGEHSRLLPLKTMCTNQGGFAEEFYGNGSRVGLLIRLGCMQGLGSLILFQVIFLMNFLVPLVWPQMVSSGLKNANIFICWVLIL